jgi:hypothetical protein
VFIAPLPSYTRHIIIDGTKYATPLRCKMIHAFFIVVDFMIAAHYENVSCILIRIIKITFGKNVYKIYFTLPGLTLAYPSA